MKPASPNTLARTLRSFFADHLPRVRGTSPHTVHSYRDTFVLLLRFIADRRQRSVADLDVEDLGPQDVLDFLHHLEVERRNVAATRNVRLAAIHAFFRYCAAEHPERIEHCQRILAVPFKRARSRPVEYLEFPEIQAVLAAIDRSTTKGRRDYALLASMFNTGARVQEIVTLRVADLRLDPPPHLRLFGKECHPYCISFRRRDETTGTHAGRQACALASSSADVLRVVRTDTAVGRYTDAHGAGRVAPRSGPWAA
jgi:integrase/recombinase XerD